MNLFLRTIQEQMGAGNSGVDIGLDLVNYTS